MMGAPVAESPGLGRQGNGEGRIANSRDGQGEEG